MLQRELETAIALAKEAGKVLLKHHRSDFVTEEKIGVDNFSEPVTIADREASHVIVHGLAAAFPNDGILSEEEPDIPDKRLAHERVWIIDPMDGTAGFVEGHGDFGVQIGLADGKRPVLGVVYLPAFDKLYYAELGEGSHLSEGGNSPVRLKTSGNTAFPHMPLAVSRNHLSPRMGRIIKHFGFERIVNRGSVGLKVGLIAERSCDVYIHPSPRTKLWDTCAPEIILTEAGGCLTDLFGGRIDYSAADLQNHNGILATNGLSHKSVLDNLQPLLAEFGRVPFKR